MNLALYDLLEMLDASGFHYTLSRNRRDSILVTITFVGERIEVEVFNDGHMEVSRFLGTEDILGGKELIYDLIHKKISEDRSLESQFGDRKQGVNNEFEKHS